ncbi:two-component sensor histidine kinase [Anopheles sinensis]|uniref:Two-component sensor histidine kinase n=1 Tax=Anopheles sinensis TaxID=74873 RepID=A0A084W504_ANOSI|nr:two-component sensor histidine kinase [Anopheles sinensis]
MLQQKSASCRGVVNWILQSVCLAILPTSSDLSSSGACSVTVVLGATESQSSTRLRPTNVAGTWLWVPEPVEFTAITLVSIYIYNGLRNGAKFKLSCLVRT